MNRASATSIENSSLLDYLQWSDDDCRMDEFVDRFTLPQIVKVQEDLNIHQANNNSCIDTQQLLTLHAVESTEKVLARDRKDREVHLPLDCSNRIELRPHSFRGVCETVAHLRGFKFVRVTQGYCMDDESCTISTGDKLEVIGVEEGNGRQEGCLVVQNQVQFTIRLPFSVTAGFQPLVDGREYSLKEASAMELPVYFQFIDQPDPIGQEGTVGVFNCSLGVLKFEKTYCDSIIISTAMTGCATTAIVYPNSKVVSRKVLGTPKEDHNYAKICRMFHDRISLPKVRSKELENIHASRNTIREYRGCIEAGFAVIVEKIVGEGSRSNSDPILSDPIDAQVEVSEGSGDPRVLIEEPVFSSFKQQEAENISDDCHDICDDVVPPQSLLTDKPQGELTQGLGTDRLTETEAPLDFSAGVCYFLSGVTETATDDHGDLDLGHPTSTPTDRLSDEAAQHCVEDNRITDTLKQRILAEEQSYMMGKTIPATRNTEEDGDSKAEVANQGPVHIDAPSGKVVRLDNNQNKIDIPLKSNAEQGLRTSHKKQRPPVPKRTTLIRETADMKTESSQALDKVTSPTQRILKKTKSAPVVKPRQPPDCTGRAAEESEARRLFTGPEKKEKPKLPVKPSAKIIGEIRAGVKARHRPSPVKTEPVFRESGPPPVHENSDTDVESGRAKLEAPPTATEPSSTRISLPTVATGASHHDERVEGSPMAMETEIGYDDGCDAVKAPAATSSGQQLSTKPSGQRISLDMEAAASHSEVDDAIEPIRDAGIQSPARRPESTTGGTELRRPPPLPLTKPKPPHRRHLSHPAGESEATGLVTRDRATSTGERRPPPVKPKPARRSLSLALN